MLDPRVVRQQIENLKVQFPSLVDDDDAWQMSLESETDINSFLTNLVTQIDDCKALVVGTKERFEELKARKERFERRIEVLRELAFKTMHAAEVAKVELPIATLSLRAGTPQVVGYAEPEMLPDRLCKISREVDRTKVKDALKNGVIVPGYQLSNAPPSLSIRIK